ncbi:MAG: peptidase dipeptidase [Gemmatimonadetes bacterium]|nr:peptidase dipeptidase [Gemmatimonadota bacterium]
MPRLQRIAAVVTLATLSCTQRASQPNAAATGAPRVGPDRGTVIVVGGGVVGPEIVAKFIEAAGGPDALIVDVPTAGGAATYAPNWRGTDFLKAGGARNVVVMHTTDKAVANSDQFVEPLKRAGGVWFEGGRQWHLVDSYADTKSEQGFHDVLARGGVVGGSSAGASILSSYMLRGAREGNEAVMAPGYEKAFGFLRGVAIDQHVVARERLRDLADSLMPKHPELLGISEDEGTAWVIRGDVADVIGRNKAFVYGGKDATDPRKPFTTLYPGDTYDLGARRIVHRGSDDSPLTGAYVDGLMQEFGASTGGMTTVLVARNGTVLVDRSYGVPDHPKYMPGTTVPNFPLGGLSHPINALVAELFIADGKLKRDEMLGSSGLTLGQYLASEREIPGSDKLIAELVAMRTDSTYAAVVTRAIYTPIGAHKTTVNAVGAFMSNVDELYRLELVMENMQGFSKNIASVEPPAGRPTRTLANHA